MERQTGQLVVVQFKVDQFPESAELGGESLQTIVTEVQEPQAALQGGKTEGVAEGFQVVVVQDEFREAAQITDSGREFLDVVVAEVQLTKSYEKNREIYYTLLNISKYFQYSTSTFEGEHPHVHP